MDLVVSPIVDQVIQITFSLIKEELLLIWGVKGEIDKLASNLTAIKATLNDAAERQLNGKHLQDWLGKLKDVADDAEDLLDTFATEFFLWKKKHKERRIPTPFSISIRSDVAHEIKKLSTRIEVIAKERQNFRLNNNIDSVISPSHDLPPTDYFVDATEVFGREDDKQKIIDMLRSDNGDEEGSLSVIPIVGMGGLGKTTLAQLVYNDERIEEHFELSRMWVSVSVDFNLTRILRGIIESYSKMPLPADLSPNLVLSRFREFLPGKRFLLVLDDVWNDNYNDWEQLLQLLKLGSKGSKVIVTSRSEKVANIVATQPPHHLEYLPENECWSIFERRAFKDGNLPYPLRVDLEDIGKEIVAKCKGLPLAIKTMGGLLRGNTDPHKWRRILKSNTWEIDDQNILPALKLSYNHLPAYLKQCFAFCSIFPKAYAFDKKELVKLWMAHSFVQPIEHNSTEDIAGEYFDILLMRSFFQPMNIDNKVRYRMHDLTHDLALSISRPQCYQVKDNKPQPQNSANWRHVSLLCQNVEEPAMEIANHSKKLRTLLLPREQLKNFGKALDKLFHSLKYIRALDLSSTTLTELPSSIEECKLLRYLDLSMTEIRKLPNKICNLYNLQTLKLLGCLWLLELPHDLGNLVNLCHLELDEMFWFKCTSLPANIGNLKGLRNLHKFKVHNQPGYQIRELKEMAYLTGELHISNLEVAVDAAEAKLNEKERLQKLVFEWTIRDDNDAAAEEKVLGDLQPHSDLKEFAISNYAGTRFPSWMTDGRLRNLVSMSLFNCTRSRILSISELPNLKALYIKKMQELDIVQSQCLNLRVLKISGCNRLSELPEFLPNLTVLKIKRCASLKALPVSPSLMFLILVDNLVLEDWQEAMVQRIIQNDHGAREHVTEPYPSFIGLLEMKVINCPKLSALPCVFAPQKLEISECELLTSLPSSRFAQRLQHVALDRCKNGTLLRAIPDTVSLYSLVISNVANVLSLPKLPNLPGLKALYIHNCEDLKSLSEEEGSFQSLTSLRILSIKGCQKLVALPNEGLPTLLECLSVGSCSNLQSLGSNKTLKSLSSLQDLYIDDCQLLQSFPEDGLPTSLQHLYIQNCPQLIERCKKGEGPEWTKIENIPDLEIDLIQVRSARQLQKKKPRFPFTRGRGLNSQI